MKNRFRQLCCLLFGLVFSNRAVTAILGALNRRFGFIHTVFVAYPAKEDYARAYLPATHSHRIQWDPWPVGFFRQGRAWGIMCVIASLEDDFASPENTENLRALAKSTEAIRERLGARQTCFSGVLPGVLYARRIRTEIAEAEVTVAVMLEVEKRLRVERNLPDDTPLVILGARGFIGRRFCKALNGRDITSIDLNDTLSPDAFDRPTIVFNVSRKNAVSDYIDTLPETALLVNEVYPEPSPEEIGRMEERRLKAWHIVGLRAVSYPPFPDAYRGGIPCCAGIISEAINPIIAPLTRMAAA